MRWPILRLPRFPRRFPRLIGDIKFDDLILIIIMFVGLLFFLDSCAVGLERMFK